MFYPEEFKKRVKEVYPDCEELHRKLDFGDDFIGIYLYNGSKSNSEDVFLNASSLNKMQEKMNLYNEWLKLERERHTY